MRHAAWPVRIAATQSEEDHEKKGGEEEEDLQYCGHTGQIALSDYPHARHNCAEHAFVPGNEVNRCSQCYW